MRKFASLLFILAIGTLSGCASETESAAESTDHQSLRTAVFTAVNDATEGKWDKEVLVDEIHSSQRAAKGKWVAEDHWDWIAWTTDDTAWNVLVSLDGFDCDTLGRIPNKFDEFFKNILYQFDSTKPYCHAWSD